MHVKQKKKTPFTLKHKKSLICIYWKLISLYTNFELYNLQNDVITKPVNSTLNIFK